MVEAQASLGAGRWQSALAEADEAILAIAGQAEGHVLRGRALGELGRLPEAAEAFTRALELDVAALDRVEDGAHAARLSARAGDHRLAARILPRVLGTMPASAQRHDLYALYGDVLLSLGPDRLRDATIAFREAVRQGGRGNIRPALGLALSLRRQAAADRSQLDLDEAWDVARQASVAGRLEAILGALPVTVAERAARRAVALHASGDAQGAREAWREAASAPVWRRHAQHELGLLGAPGPRGRSGPQRAR